MLTESPKALHRSVKQAPYLKNKNKHSFAWHNTLSLFFREFGILQKLAEVKIQSDSGITISNIC